MEKGFEVHGSKQRVSLFSTARLGILDPLARQRGWQGLAAPFGACIRTALGQARIRHHGVGVSPVNARGSLGRRLLRLVEQAVLALLAARRMAMHPRQRQFRLQLRNQC